ncbi:AbrB family transcriptional regulator [Shimia sp. R11_0]|uniref:AbrB family transcriptional regulator n=1 Tax=Shimia sp. R11_0 TaxID=2821096 RepID=UPI001AD97F8B|nr:AbrB family transcriptional regulator [Shimia sp. R11_0]MBO9477287.1 AbrB family transcriptional regulator [Shimia sp. R11_0]
MGALGFWKFGLPLPFLFGPMAACLLAALCGAQFAGFGQVTVAARTILGVAVGTSITPEVAGQLPSMMGSLALMPLYILLIAVVGVPFFHKICKFDPITSYYAAMPGGLQDMILFGEEAGGNARVLSLIHATRVLVILLVAPIMLVWVYDVSLSNPIGEPASQLPLHEMFIMAGAALLGWKGGERLGLFGASILGPMIVSAALTMGGVLHSRPPQEAIWTAQFFIGVVIGVHYVGVTLRELRSVVLSGLAFMVVLAILTVSFAKAVTFLDVAPEMEAFLAFAPGGQAEMTLLAIVVGADLGFVIAHHLSRIVLVILGAPVAARFVRRVT